MKGNPIPAGHHESELDSLASLEERITKAVEVVSGLRNERDAAHQELETALTALDAAKAEAVAATEQGKKAVLELEDLKNERKQVRTRIEKLLGQMDLLSGS